MTKEWQERLHRLRSALHSRDWTPDERQALLGVLAKTLRDLDALDVHPGWLGRERA